MLWGERQWPHFTSYSPTSSTIVQMTALIAAKLFDLHTPEFEENQTSRKVKTV